MECPGGPSPTGASRLVLVSSGKAELLCQLLLHWTQGVLVGTTGGPMVTFANTTGHNLLSFNFIHGVFVLVLGVQILNEQKGHLVTRSTCTSAKWKCKYSLLCWK